MKIEVAQPADAKAIVFVLAANRNDPGLFQKPESLVRKTHAEWIVAREVDGRVVGCASLHRESDILAELHGVAVLPELQGKGIGGEMIRECEQRAAALGISKLWLATIKPEYFGRYSFHPMSRWSLPFRTMLRKFRQVFQQPVDRWLPALFGRHTFMQCDLSANGPGSKPNA